MNLTSELDAVKRYHRVIGLQRATLLAAEEELGRQIAGYKEERFCLLVERAVDAGKGWCTLCDKTFPLDHLHATVSQNSIHAVCFMCGSILCSLQKKDVVLWVSGDANSYPLPGECEVGIMHRWSRQHISNESIPPELAAEFIPEVPEIRLDAIGQLIIGGEPHLPSAE